MRKALLTNLSAFLGYRYARQNHSKFEDTHHTSIFFQKFHFNETIINGTILFLLSLLSL